MTTAGQQQANPARAGGPAAPSGLRAGSPGRGQETTHRLTETGPDRTRADARRTCAAARRAGEHAQAARSASCPYPAGPGVSRGPSGDHLARYLRAGHRTAITRESLQEVIAGLAARDPLEAPPYTARCPERGEAAVRLVRLTWCPGKPTAWNAAGGHPGRSALRPAIGPGGGYQPAQPLRPKPSLSPPPTSPGWIRPPRCAPDRPPRRAARRRPRLKGGRDDRHRHPGRRPQ